MDVYQFLILFLAFLIIFVGFNTLTDYRIITTHGDSMKPTLGYINVSIYKVVDAEEIEKGDIVVYDTGTYRVNHRYIGMQGDYYVFKGDNNTYKEYIDDPDRIKYKLVQHIINIG